MSQKTPNDTPTGLDRFKNMAAPSFEVLASTPKVYPDFGDDIYFAGETTDNGVKQPRAPWAGDDAIPDDKGYDHIRWDSPVGYNWEGVATDIDTAREWAEMVPKWYLAAQIPKVEDASTVRLILFDFDNCRHPETGEVHPFVSDFIHRAGSYAQVSYSGTGIHVYVYGSIPEGYKPSVTGSLDAWGHEDAAGGEPVLEMYSSSRFIALTGRHVDISPETVEENSPLAHEIVREYGTPVDVAGDRSDWEPTVSKDDMAGIETTDDMEVVFDAIAHTDYGDFRLKSTQTQGAKDRSARKSFDPSWESSRSGTRLGHDSGGWIYRKGDIGLDSLQVVALEERIITSVHDYPSGRDFWRAVEELRRRGAHIPKYTAPRAKQKKLYRTVTFPELGGAEDRIGWTPQLGDDADAGQENVYQKVEAVVDRAMSDGGASLVYEVMGSGKTYSALKVGKERDEQLFYSAPRVDMYEQAVKYAMEIGYERDTIKVLPSYFRDCPSANGDHGDSLKNFLHHVRGNGVTPQEAHAYLDLPCEEHGDCPYRAAMQFDPDDFDLLIGHYTHTHLPQALSGRHVLIDEDPSDVFLTEISGDQLVTSVNTFLAMHDSPPFENFTDLVANRDDPERRKQAKMWFDVYAAQRDWESDSENAIRYEQQNYHALTPHAVYGILMGKEVSDGISRATTNGRNPVIFSDADDSSGYKAIVNTPPSEAMHYAKSVIGLDGTPMGLDENDPHAKVLGEAPMWNLALNLRFTVRAAMSEDERREWLRDSQNIHIVPMSEYVKPYSSGKYANEKTDFAVIEAARNEYGFDPTVITTKKVRDRYEPLAEDAELGVREWNHYGNIRGSNEYESRRLGIILGSTHYGDDYLKERAALLGVEIEPEGKGADRTYGNAVGDSLLEAMRESTVAQSILRFGRDGKGAVVLVHTSAIPDWLPTTEPGNVTATWTDTQREVIDLLAEGWEGTARELSEIVGVSKEQCHNVLNGLRDRGFAAADTATGIGGTRFVWHGTGDEVPIYGETTLPISAADFDFEESVEYDVEDFIRDTSYFSAPEGRYSVHHVQQVSLDVKKTGVVTVGPPPGGPE